jgi:hypothetical protein
MRNIVKPNDFADGAANGGNVRSFESLIKVVSRVVAIQLCFTGLFRHFGCSLKKAGDEAGLLALVSDRRQYLVVP